QGLVLVYRGSATGVSAAPTVLTAPQGKLEFGGWVTPAGDINGDGYGDVLITAPYNTASEYLYYGSPSGLTLRSTVLAGNPGFGVRTVSDVNGDGYSDVIVAKGGPTNTNKGEVDVYLGIATGLSTSPTVITFSGSNPNSNGYFGVYAADAGDVNG